MNTNNQVTEIETEAAEDVQVAVTDESGKKTTKRVPSRLHKFLPPTKISGREGRIPCAGGCRTMVLKSSGECRKCRRTRLKNGKRVIAKITKQQKNIIHAG